MLGLGLGLATARRRPRGGSGETPGAPTEIWANYFTDAGISNGAAQTAIQAFFAGLVADGLNGKIKVFVLLGAESATAKNMMADAYHGALIGSPTHTPWLGVRFNGSSQYVSTGTAPSAISGISLNSACIGIGAAQDTPDTNQSLPGWYMYAETYDAPSEYQSLGITPIATVDGSDVQTMGGFYTVNDFGNLQVNGVTSPDFANFRLYASRTGETVTKWYLRDTEIDESSESSVAIPTEPMFIGAANLGGTPEFTGGYHGEYFQAKWYCIAEGLNGTEQAALDGRIVTLISALEALA